MAGARTVEEIFARGGDEMFDIAIFGDEPSGNYNRIMLFAVLEGTTDPEAILINPLRWYDEHGIGLHAGVRAERIFRYARSVIGSDGIQEPYDKLIIATGSHPFIPPLDGLMVPDGILKPGIFGFRTLTDCRQIAAYAAGKRCVAVVGGGLLGLECARALLKFDVEVHIFHHAVHLMNLQIDPPAGAILKAQIEKMGINVHLGADVRTIVGEEHVAGLAFADGQTMDCEMVVFATGTRPNYEIGRSCGLTIERAIVVDDQMRSVDDPNIYAVGECIQHGGRTYGLVAPLWEQAKVLADHITGRDPKAAYHGSRIATKLKVAGIELASMGAIEPGGERDEVVQFSEPRKGTYKKVLIRDGHLLGAILLGDISKAAYLLHTFDSNTPLPEERVNLLFDIGAPPKQVTFEQIPPDTQICNCNGVSKGAIIACTQSGKRTPKAVMEATRAGMGCGSCKTMVAEIIEWACEGQLEDDPSAHYYVPGVPLAKAELINQIRALNLKSVSAVFNALAGGNDDPSSKPGLASLLDTIWAEEYEDERDARFINDRVHANIQKNGTFSVIPQIPGGVTSPAQLRRIADVAEKYNFRWSN
jgi:nitrite reductase (NADH) large subunit